MSRKRKARCKRPRRRGRPRVPLLFPIGTLVRVRSGVSDPDFPDIPLGGWSGTVRDVDADASPPSYLVRWDEPTLANMHPVVRKRCQRDDFMVQELWLEEDALEPATGEPVPMEQPTALVTRPLNRGDPEDRIRAVFGLTSDDPLPDVDEENLRAYRHYLAAHLPFPFRASYTINTGPSDIQEFDAVVRCLSDEVSESEGLYAEIGEGAEQFTMPLAELEVEREDRNQQLVEDYATWLGNEPVGRIPRQLVALLKQLEPGPRPSYLGLFPNWGLLWAALYGAGYGFLLGLLLGCGGPVLTGAEVGAAGVGLVGGWIAVHYGRGSGTANQLGLFLLLSGILGTVLGAAVGGWPGPR